MIGGIGWYHRLVKPRRPVWCHLRSLLVLVVWMHDRERGLHNGKHKRQRIWREHRQASRIGWGGHASSTQRSVSHAFV